jgi:putative tryptophan/tyrosine transport system substrate-binding protein
VIPSTSGWSRASHALGHFASLVQARTGVLLVGADLFVANRIEQLIALAAHHAIPTMYPAREFVVAGGLVSYGTSLIEEYRQVGLYDRLPALATELTSQRIAVVAGTGGEAAGLAAKAATTTIPIVFIIGGDPVVLGLVASFNKPGGNVTGVTVVVTGIAAKRLGLLRQLLPNAATIAILTNPSFPSTSGEVHDLRAGAQSLGLQINVLEASTPREIDAALATLVRARPDALFVAGDAFLLGQRDKIVSLLARYTIPAIYPQREYVDAGGLISYGASVNDAYRQAGIYTGRILKGEKPNDLPVMQSNKFELLINLKTAKALSLNIPPTMLALADEVIE